MDEGRKLLVLYTRWKGRPMTGHERQLMVRETGLRGARISS
jgi:hypothetical protein